MRQFFYSIFAHFLTPWGLFVLGALDASLVFFLPFGIDIAVIFTSARHQTTFWVYPLLATTGSLTGAAVTFWAGRKVGEAGLERLLPAARLKRIKRRVREKGAVAMAVPAILPPPFPFTPFILTSGALEVDRQKFFGTLAAIRLARFGIESVLARRYGQGIVAWLRSDLFQTIVALFIFVAFAGTAYSIYRLVQGTPSARPKYSGEDA